MHNGNIYFCILALSYSAERKHIVLQNGTMPFCRTESCHSAQCSVQEVLTSGTRPKALTARSGSFGIRSAMVRGSWVT